MVWQADRYFYRLVQGAARAFDLWPLLESCRREVETLPRIDQATGTGTSWRPVDLLAPVTLRTELRGHLRRQRAAVLRDLPNPRLPLFKLRRRTTKSRTERSGSPAQQSLYPSADSRPRPNGVMCQRTNPSKKTGPCRSSGTAPHVSWVRDLRVRIS